MEWEINYMKWDINHIGYMDMPTIIVTSGDVSFKFTHDEFFKITSSGITITQHATEMYNQMLIDGRDDRLKSLGI